MWLVKSCRFLIRQDDVFSDISSTIFPRGNQTFHSDVFLSNRSTSRWVWDLLLQNRLGLSQNYLWKRRRRRFVNLKYRKLVYFKWSLVGGYTIWSQCCRTENFRKDWILRGLRSSSFWVPRNLSHHVISQARTGDKVLVKSREMTR